MMRKEILPLQLLQAISRLMKSTMQHQERRRREVDRLNWSYLCWCSVFYSFCSYALCKFWFWPLI